MASLERGPLRIIRTHVLLAPDLGLLATFLNSLLKPISVGRVIRIRPHKVSLP